MISSCPGTSIPTLLSWLTDSLTVLNLEPSRPNQTKSDQTYLAKLNDLNNLNNLNNVNPNRFR